MIAAQKLYDKRISSSAAFDVYFKRMLLWFCRQRRMRCTLCRLPIILAMIAWLTAVRTDEGRLGRFGFRILG